MKKQLLFLLITILSFNCYSQIFFEKGYYINNSDQKIDCLIKNVDWRNNPINFEYKLTENSEPKNTNIKTVKEFGIYNTSKYIRNTVKIDRSSENANELSKKRDPIFVEEQLFLKVLIEGKANLYFYGESGLKRYFYNKENSTIEQLVFKKYETSDNEMGKNNYYKQQLWKDLKCTTITLNKIENLVYKKSNLINLFTVYNKCSTSDFISYEKKQKRDLFNLSIRPGFNNSSLSIQRNNSINNNTNTGDADFDNKLAFRFGIEAEIILPFNNNKWAITIEPTYQSYKSKKTIDATNVSGNKVILDVNYKSIEIPLSFRHYFFLDNNSKLFVNASYIFDFSFNSSIELTRIDDSNLTSLEIKTVDNLAIGAGYKHNDKYSLEFRYQTKRDILGSFTSWNSDYKTFSIIFGYSIF